jgi:GntR family carbon starvation induced transcriptional regulator
MVSTVSTDRDFVRKISRVTSDLISVPAPPELDLAPTMSGQAYAALRSDILAGDIAPGAKLKMHELQHRYHLSSSPLREALSRLVAEQIVTVYDRKGFRAARVSLEDLSDITKFRLILEVSAFEAAISNGTAEWEAECIAALHRLRALDRALPAKERSWDRQWIAAHKAFHIALISACGSRRLLDACSAMFDQSQRYRSLSARYRTSPRNSGLEHRRLLDAALQRDSAVGRELLGDHSQKTANQVSLYLANPDNALDLTGAAGGSVRL